MIFEEINFFTSFIFRLIFWQSDLSCGDSTGEEKIKDLVKTCQLCMIKLE